MGEGEIESKNLAPDFSTHQARFIFASWGVGGSGSEEIKSRQNSEKDTQRKIFEAKNFLKKNRMEIVKKIKEAHIPLKHLLFYLVVLLVVLFFLKEQELFERILMLLIPFLIGSSVKLSYLSFLSLV